MIVAEQKNNQKLQEGTIKIQRDRWQMAEYRRVYIVQLLARILALFF